MFFKHHTELYTRVRISKCNKLGENGKKITTCHDFFFVFLANFLIRYVAICDCATT